MKPLQQRTDKYGQKYVPATVSLKVAAQLSTMHAGFAGSGMADLYAKEVLMQAALNAITPSIPTILYPFYLNFGRQLWAASHKGLNGYALADTGHALKTKYLAYGIAAPGIDAIAALFSVTGI
ncbi:MAG: hypothetical protein ABSC21_23745 [Terriglobia bacterium]